MKYWPSVSQKNTEKSTDPNFILTLWDSTFFSNFWDTLGQYFVCGICGVYIYIYIHRMILIYMIWAHI